MVNTTGRLACKFYTHGVCVSFIMERFKRDETKCIPACDSYQFHMENLHVRENLHFSPIMTYLTFEQFLIVLKVSQRKCRLSVTVAETAAFRRRYCNAFSQRSTEITHELFAVLKSFLFKGISIKPSSIFLKMQTLS